MVFRGLDSDFGSVIVGCSSVSGVWLVSEGSAAVAEWVLAAMRRAGDARSYPRMGPVVKKWQI